ncbi:MAG: V-type ATPase subunit [Candidatus Sedimenticola sp. PURPLELP]
MTAPASHTYLNTRAAILADRLLSEQDFSELTELTLEQLGRDFGVTDLLEEKTSSATINRATERALISTLMHELSVLLRPLKGPARYVLIHWIRKFELYNLKALIRGKLNHLTYEELRENLYDLPALISLPHQELLRTENIAELLRQLEQSHYSDIARQARRVYEEKNEPFSLDATIDQRYYAGLLKRARSTEVEDNKPLSELIGTLIDQQNLLWLLRYRFGYGLAPSGTYYLLVPFGKLLSRDLLKKLVNMNSFSEVIESLPDSIREEIGETEHIMDVELAMSQITAKKAFRMLKLSDSGVTRALAFLVLREIDLKRIYAIFQGKVLNLDQNLIRQAAGLSELTEGGQA